jgi:hypothetical protein
VTLIQRFGSALNLKVHFHMLFLDGVYTTTPWGKSRFHRAYAPTSGMPDIWSGKASLSEMWKTAT